LTRSYIKSTIRINYQHSLSRPGRLYS